MEDDFADFISHLSDDARLSVQYADAIARGYGNPYIGTEHLLLGILSQSASLGYQGARRCWYYAAPGGGFTSPAAAQEYYGTDWWGNWPVRDGSIDTSDGMGNREGI